MWFSVRTQVQFVSKKPIHINEVIFRNRVALFGLFFSGKKGDSLVMQSFSVKLLNYFVQDTLGPQDPERKGTPGNNHANTQLYIPVAMGLK